MVQRYHVGPNDTLANIAQDKYGDADLWHVIAAANHICDATKIFDKENLLIPDVLDRHTVQPGDTFSALALKWYGNEDLARYIAMANNRENPHNIGEPGWVAVIPELTERVPESTSGAPMVSNEVFRLVSLRRSRASQDGGSEPDPRLRYRDMLASQANVEPSPGEVRLRELRQRHAELSSKIGQYETVGGAVVNGYLRGLQDVAPPSGSDPPAPLPGRSFIERVVARLDPAEAPIFGALVTRLKLAEVADIGDAIVGDVMDRLQIGPLITEANAVCTQIEAIEEDDTETWPTVPPQPGGATPMVVAVGWGDLVVATETLVGYTAREIAHIENILTGEVKLREHQRLSKTEEVTETEIITEKETEKDSQTTDRFELQAHSQEAISQDFSVTAGFNVSGRYGLTKFEASLDTAFSQSESQSRSNSVNTAREVVSKAVERTFERVRRLRRLTITEEIRELNRHELSNVSAHQQTKSISGMYLWVEKIQRMDLRDYGTRMMVEFHVPEPAVSLLERSTAAKKRRRLPAFDVAPSGIDEGNYMCLAQRYGALDVEPPPTPFVDVGWSWVSKINEEAEDDGEDAFTSTINLPAGYRPTGARVAWSGLLGDAAAGKFNFTFSVAGKSQNNVEHKVITQDPVILDLVPYADWPQGVPVSGRVHGSWDGAMHVHVKLSCVRTSEALDKWRLRTWEALRVGYESLARLLAQQQQQEASLSSMLGPVIEQPAAEENRRIERGELQKWAIKAMRRVPQNFNAIEQVEEFQEISVTHADAQAPIVRFYEDAFEWEHMNYFLYSYHWARRASWRTRTALQATDARYRAFLEAGAARVIVPVTPGFEDKVMGFLDPPDPAASELDRILGPSRTAPPGTENPFRDVWIELLTEHKPGLARGSGTLAVTKDSRDVKINDDSNWRVTSDRDVGRELYIFGDRYEVAAVIADRSLRLDRPYEGATANKAAYAAGSTPYGPPWTVNVPTSLVVLAENVTALKQV